MTNFERIKAMSVEEMAEFIANSVPHGDCYGCDMCHDVQRPYKMNDCCEEAWLIYLESEVEEK